MPLGPQSYVSPTEIALLLAVPTSKAEFLSTVGHSDWLGKYFDSDLEPVVRDKALESHWAEEYSPFVAEPLQTLCNLALSLNVEVRKQAVLSDLEQCSAAKNVVILFAHWKGPEVLAEDFIQPIDRSRFLERLVNDTNGSALVSWLLGALGSGKMPSASIINDLLTRVFHRGSREMSLREALMKSLSTPLSSLTSQDAITVLETTLTQMARRRDELNRLFQGLLKPGNRLELSDRLYSKEEIEAAIDPSFEGILDLTVCTSTTLADYIASQRRYRVRTVQFPTAQDLFWNARCISETLHLVANGNPYIVSRLTASRVVEDALRQVMH